jgi:general secretion pathway protein C
LYIRKVLFISKLSLGLVLAIVIVRTAMIPQEMGRILAPKPAAGTETINAAAESRIGRVPMEDYSAIVSQNIFGGASYSSDVNETLLGDDTGRSVRSAEEELGLALVGTVAGSPAVSRAVIKDIRTNMLNLYKTGQTVGGACIESIEKNAVILLHNGQRKKLTLKAAAEEGGNHTQAPSSRTVGQTTVVTKPSLQLNQAPAQTSAKTEQVESMLGKAVVEPYKVKGQVEGLRITGLEGISVAKDLGLKNGDIIRVVNGQQVTSKQMAYQIFRKARTQTTMDIELLRGNEPQRLSFVLR